MSWPWWVFHQLYNSTLLYFTVYLHKVYSRVGLGVGFVLWLFKVQRGSGETLSLLKVHRLVRWDDEYNWTPSFLIFVWLFFEFVFVLTCLVVCPFFFKSVWTIPGVTGRVLEVPVTERGYWFVSTSRFSWLFCPFFSWLDTYTRFLSEHEIDVWMVVER